MILIFIFIFAIGCDKESTCVLGQLNCHCLDTGACNKGICLDNICVSEWEAKDRL